MRCFICAEMGPKGGRSRFGIGGYKDCLNVETRKAPYRRVFLLYDCPKAASSRHDKIKYGVRVISAG